MAGSLVAVVAVLIGVVSVVILTLCIVLWKRCVKIIDVNDSAVADIFYCRVDSYFKSKVYKRYNINGQPYLLIVRVEHLSHLSLLTFCRSTHSDEMNMDTCQAYNIFFQLRKAQVDLIIDKPWH